MSPGGEADPRPGDAADPGLRPQLVREGPGDRRDREIRALSTGASGQPGGV